jgi:hypothetical protein
MKGVDKILEKRKRKSLACVVLTNIVIQIAAKYTNRPAAPGFVTVLLFDFSNTM